MMNKIITINELRKLVFENNETAKKYGWWHGSTDKNFSGKRGIHIGTFKSATEALESRIGVPAEGSWDGTRIYKDTLLAGKKSLVRIAKERGYSFDNALQTGYNAGSPKESVPENDYYPEERIERPVYSDGTEIDLNSKPIVFQVRIIGSMTNTPRTPHSDSKANSLIRRGLTSGNAKRGFYYINDSEDRGSISAVVPDGSFLRIV